MTITGTARQRLARRWLFAGLALGCALASAESLSWASAFEREVTPRLQLPADQINAYADRLQAVFAERQMQLEAAQFIVLVDRAPQVQAALLFWGSSAKRWVLIGATPVSTGLPGRYEHFVTPLGVFDHSLLNPDFRAEGTKNKLGFRGYGRKGRRVYDFGWVAAPRGWGDGALGILRLQMHATDPDLAEPRLGSAQSEGCVRISASLNEFIDRYGLLDEQYEGTVNASHRPWVLRKDRTPTATPGRYLVVIDSEATERPTWAALPKKMHKP